MFLLSKNNWIPNIKTKYHLKFSQCYLVFAVCIGSCNGDKRSWFGEYMNYDCGIYQLTSDCETRASNCFQTSWYEKYFSRNHETFVVKYVTICEKWIHRRKEFQLFHKWLNPNIMWYVEFSESIVIMFYSYLMISFVDSSTVHSSVHIFDSIYMSAFPFLI